MTKIQTIGLIGSGNIGSTVARLAIAAGYSVVLSNSRGPETLADLVDSLGPSARAATPEEAAAAGDLVVVTVPLKAYAAVPVAPLAGKVVIDTNNYYPDRDGVIDEIERGESTTSELLQGHLPDSQVVKAFNNIFYVGLNGLARPTGDAERSTLPIYGNHDAAKETVTTFLDTIGYDVLDAGELAESWRAENGRPAYVFPYAVGTDVHEARPAGRETISGLLESASREDGTAPSAAAPR